MNGPFGPHGGNGPRSAPTQLGAPRGNTPQGGVPRVQQQQYRAPSPMPRAMPIHHSLQPLPPLPAPQSPPPPPPLPASARKTAPKMAAAHVGDPQLGFRFKLAFGDGRTEQMLVDAERALIGSAAHCEVRLPPEIASHEHVEVFAHEGAVHFATKPLARDNLPTFDGAPATEGRWMSGSTLRIGDVSMTVELVSLGMAKAKPPIWALFVAIPAIALTAVGIALARPVDRGLPPIPEAPALLGAKDAQCPNVSPEQRPVLAAEKLRVALAKRERSPFAPEEGIDAIGLFEGAAACWRVSGEPELAKEADDSATALRAKIDEDYRLRRVRLEHAYRTHQLNAVKRELSVLIPMTQHRRGPYTDWLLALDRAATLELQERGRLAP